MSVFSYPFDASLLLKTKKRLRRQLLEDGTARIKKRIAVLGGSTTNDVVDMLELFLLDFGIEPTFWQSEYGRYWQDAMFETEKLKSFAPDIVYIHTTTRNLENFLPGIGDSAEKAEQCFADAKEHFLRMWERLQSVCRCPLIQNNFEQPPYRLLGNRDASDIHGALRFVRRMNGFVSEYAEKSASFYIDDIDYVSACYGLDRWHDLSVWYLYKYAMALHAIPYLAFNLANIVKAIFGKNKKALALDLDNTLWGGIVGDDGVEGLELGSETPTAQAYLEFQQYLKKVRGLGVLLTVCSKNDYENAIAGLKHPDSALSPDDFALIKANWDPKHLNLVATAKELNILPDSIVFADDNPAERDIVAQSLPVAVPVMDTVDRYIQVLDRSGFFEVTSLSEDDLKRNEMYKANALRQQQLSAFTDYGEYLKSLEMKAEIKPFAPLYIQRIAQLTNKSNQFNLTTRRYTAEEIAKVASDGEHICLSGRLADRFGDNGVVSVVIGRAEGAVLHMELWLMSCRVLKRDMEYAMLDALVGSCKRRGIGEIRGYYYPTAKNSMVRELYGTLGFELLSRDGDGSSVWSLKTAAYEKKNKYIEVESGAEND